MQLTSNTGEELSGEALNLTAWKWHKPISFEKVKNTLAEQICYYAYMIAEIERIPKMYAFVSIRFVVESQCREYSQFNS